MSGDARGGNDSLTARATYSALYGDAYSMSGDARGGNDSLTATGDCNDVSSATPARCPTTPAAATTA